MLGLDDLWRRTVASAKVVELPLRVPFRGITHRQAVLIRGAVGWGEFSPFPEYPAQEASWWLDSAIEAAWFGWPPPVRPAVGVNAIIPAVPADRAASLARAAQAAGYRTVKVKVAAPSGSASDDADRVRAVRQVFEGKIRVDANAAWTVTQAVEQIEALQLAASGLEYVEQPCPTLPELAEVRLRTGVRVAADESIRRAEDPLHAARIAAADVLVVKAAPLGGVRRALRVVAQSELPVVVSSALDTAVGLASGIALAAAVPNLAGDCGLGTCELFVADVSRAPAVPQAGAFEAARLPIVDPQALRAAEQRVSGESVRWWRTRLADAWNAGSRERVARMLADSAV